MTPLVLASSSPRRADLLRQAGIPFEARAADVDESHPGPPELAVREVALRKAAASRVEGRFVLAADTLVVLEGRALGKPRDAADARRMLAALSGRTHHILTGVVVAPPAGETRVAVERTVVEFAPLSSDAIAAYVATGEPLGKAGAYAIQGAAEAFVAGLQGSWSNVVGLPLATTVRLLREAGYPLPPHLAE